MVFFSFFLRSLGYLTGLLIFIIFVSIFIQYSNDFRKNQFEMVDGAENSKNIIVNLNLNGPILNNKSNILDSNFYDYINPKKVKSLLEELEYKNIKILIIDINSPGGTVSATAELENIFYDFKEKTNAKIYFFTNEILASGGYWIATSADKIFASYGSIIGSIGVSGPSWFYYDTPVSFSTGILGQSIETKKGIKVFNQNAGQGKDLFNPYRLPDNKEIAHLQSIVDEVYNDFVKKVSKSRKIDLALVINNIGALIYSSNQARENFLIDEILSHQELIDFIMKENNFENYKILENKTEPTSIIDLLTTDKKDYNNDSNIRNICNKLNSSLNVVLPLFLEQC